MLFGTWINEESSVVTVGDIVVRPRTAITFPNPKQKLGVVIKYNLEAEFIVFNLTRTKSMLLTKKGSRKMQD